VAVADLATKKNRVHSRAKQKQGVAEFLSSFMPISSMWIVLRGKQKVHAQSLTLKGVEEIYV
jgi:hypothetical protein